MEHALLRYRLRRKPPPAAAPELIDAQLDAFFEHLLELTAPGRDLHRLHERVANACARIEEWTD